MDSTATRIILVRHGRTALNAEGRLRGLANPELDPIGIEQALDTAFALRSKSIASVLSSPLNRAVSTAAIIAKISGVEHRAEPALNDRDYGEWTGHIKTEVIEQWGSVDAAPGVEPTETVRDRALACLNAVVGAAQGPGALGASGTAGASAVPAVAVVTHDAVIRPILAMISPGIELAVETASWSEIITAGGGWEIVSVDNTP